jgi:hypothetical protein
LYKENSCLGNNKLKPERKSLGNNKLKPARKSFENTFFSKREKENTQGGRYNLNNDEQVYSIG